MIPKSGNRFSEKIMLKKMNLKKVRPALGDAGRARTRSGTGRGGNVTGLA